MAKWINDGGHGGKDPGACSNGNIEKVYTLEASLYVDKRLADHGIESDVSRSGDVTLDEDPRINKVKKYKKCISHHFNSGGGSGVETIHSIYSDGKFETSIIEEFRKAGYPVRTRPVFFKTLPSNSKQDYYYMHRRTGACRTSIVEYDFVDGPQSEKIKNIDYRVGMYECVVRAICKDEGITYKPIQKEVAPTKNVDIVTGGLWPDAVKEILAFCMGNKWRTTIEYSGKADPYAVIGWFPENCQALADLEAWLKAKGWYYDKKYR
jgi:N-acetylmuramoyl-L-alanine amidase